ncbi:hypothetical protein N9745_01090 [bacterium]|nr:hypothetical protein [bacterium]
MIFKITERKRETNIESCILIKKTWLETGGNVSLVSRRLGVSRTTIYKHLSSE